MERVTVQESSDSNFQDLKRKIWDMNEFEFEMYIDEIKREGIYEGGFMNPLEEAFYEAEMYIKYEYSPDIDGAYDEDIEDFYQIMANDGSRDSLLEILKENVLDLIPGYGEFGTIKRVICNFIEKGKYL